MPLRVIRGALEEDPERVHALIELEDRILERRAGRAPRTQPRCRDGGAASATASPATCSTGSPRSAC